MLKNALTTTWSATLLTRPCHPSPSDLKTRTPSPATPEACPCLDPCPWYDHGQNRMKPTSVNQDHQSTWTTTATTTNPPLYHPPWTSTPLSSPPCVILGISHHRVKAPTIPRQSFIATTRRSVKDPPSAKTAKRHLPRLFHSLPLRQDLVPRRR